MEPWASLIGTGAKRYETRSWSTSYCGALLICAAKYRDRPNMDLITRWAFQGGLAPLVGKPLRLGREAEYCGVGVKDMRFGEAVAVVDLVSCIPTKKMLMTDIGSDLPFGDFAPDRYAWKLENVRSLRGQAGVVRGPECASSSVVGVRRWNQMNYAPGRRCRMTL